MRNWSLAVVVLCGLFGHASAGDKATAEATFQQGKRLMKAGKYADACSAFDRSQALDPQLGTEYNLATCHEKLGRLATAWGEFSELAQRDTNPARKRDAAKHVTALQPRLIKLLITARAAAGAVKITRNGEDVSLSVGIESPVDPGDYEIAATAEGHRPWSARISATQEGRTVQIAVPELEKLPEAVKPAAADHEVAAPAPPPPSAIATMIATPVPRASSRKTLGWIVGGSGLAITAGGLVFGALASSKWRNVEKLCGGDADHGCMAGDAFAAAQNEQKSATTFGNASTVLVGVGLAAVAAGVILHVTSPSSTGAEHVALPVIPVVTSDGFGLATAGRF